VTPATIGRGSSARDRNAVIPGGRGYFWSPKEVIRRTRATERTGAAIQGRYSDELLGHADTKITEIYAERDLELAMRVMREIG
jgi:hypothetical protein